MLRCQFNERPSHMGKIAGDQVACIVSVFMNAIYSQTSTMRNDTEACLRMHDSRPEANQICSKSNRCGCHSQLRSIDNDRFLRCGRDPAEAAGKSKVLGSVFVAVERAALG